MATTKTSNLQETQDGKAVAARLSKANILVGRDKHAYTAGQLAVNEVLLTNIKLPSNAIVESVSIYNDDLDSNVTPTLALDFGLAAAEKFTSVTSGAKTKHAQDDILDADAYVDGAADAQAATTKYTALALDSATFGPDDADKACWEVLGYDEDPKTEFLIAVTVATGAATAAAGDMAIKVQYFVD